MNLYSTAEMRRIEAEQSRPSQPTWYRRFERFWALLADAFSPRVARPHHHDSESIMSIGDD
jgi:hypothetical protein